MYGYINMAKKFKSKITDILYPDSLYILGSGDYANLGDALNYSLVKELTSRKLIFLEYLPFPRGRQEHYLIVGSTLGLKTVSEKTRVWGAGFISSGDHLHNHNVKLKIAAVRGPLTFRRLRETAITCEEVYGDPALLLPFVYNPEQKNKQYALGIVPHYTDKNIDYLKELAADPEIKIIDIEVGDDYKKFVNDILSCERIISSSLHGLIIADAYGIPSKWIQMSKNIIGGDFKFYDYFLSVHRNNEKVTQINDMDELISMKYTPISYDFRIDLKPLIAACPLPDLNKKLFGHILANPVLEYSYR